VTGAFFSATEVWGKASPTAEAAIICGTVCYGAVCSVAGMMAAIVLSAHVEDYDLWRDARSPTAEDTGFEFVDE